MALQAQFMPSEVKWKTPPNVLSANKKLTIHPDDFRIARYSGKVSIVTSIPKPQHFLFDLFRARSAST